MNGPAGDHAAGASATPPATAHHGPRVAYVKKLTLSDACTSKQIKLPRSAAETFLPLLADKESSTLDVVDEADRPWSFSCTRYNCQYALSKIGPFAKAHSLGPDIFLIFYLDQSDALRVACRWALPATLKGGLHVDEPLPNTTGRPAYGRSRAGGRTPGAQSKAAAAAAVAERAASPPGAREPAAAAGGLHGAPLHAGTGLGMYAARSPMFGAGAGAGAGMAGWGMAWAPSPYGEQVRGSGAHPLRQVAGPGAYPSPSFFSPSPSPLTRGRGEAGPSAFRALGDPSAAPGEQRAGRRPKAQGRPAASAQLPAGPQHRKRSASDAEMDKENQDTQPLGVDRGKAHCSQPAPTPGSAPRPRPHALGAGPAPPLSFWVGPQGRLPHLALTPPQFMAHAAAVEARAAALSMSAQPVFGAAPPPPCGTPFGAAPLPFLSALSDPRAAPAPRRASPLGAEPAPPLHASDSEGGSSEDARTAAAETLTLLSSGAGPGSQGRCKTAGPPSAAGVKHSEPRGIPSIGHYNPASSGRRGAPGPEPEGRPGWQPPPDGRDGGGGTWRACSPRRDIFEGVEDDGWAAAEEERRPPPSSRRAATPRGATPRGAGAGGAFFSAPDLQARALQPPHPPHPLLAQAGGTPHAWRQQQLLWGHPGAMGYGPLPGALMLPTPRHFPAGFPWSPRHVAAQQQQQPADPPAMAAQGDPHGCQAAGSAAAIGRFSLQL